MNNQKKAFLATTILTVLSGALSGQLALADSEGFTDEFFIEDCDFSSSGSNRFFVLQPGHQLVFSGEDEDGEELGLTITVLDETRELDGVKTRIIEEVETEDGELVEVVELPAADGGTPVELAFDGINGSHGNSLDGWTLTLEGTIQA